MPLTTRLKRPTVVIVDGDAERREKLLAALAPHEFRPRAVGTVREARLAIGRVQTDLVVVSDAQPAVVLRELRPVAPRTRFVVVGAADFDLYAELTSLGAVEVIPPTLSARDLALRLRVLASSDVAA